MSATMLSARVPFDEIAARYDDIFTNSVIGRAQRNAVWKEIDPIWKPGDRVLELNCGTGEDALHLAENGIAVIACDASSAMIEVANDKRTRRTSAAPVEFIVLPNEHIGSVPHDHPFDGVFSNFSGLNCIANLSDLAPQLSLLVRPRAELALCFSTRFCLWEVFWHSVHGEFPKAARRWKGHFASCVGGCKVDVHYPRVAQIEREFSRWFQLVALSGIGITVPPSYLESWAQKHAAIVSFLSNVDSFLCDKSCFRVTGDHMLLRFRRSS